MVSPKIIVLPSGTLSFVHIKIWPWHVHRRRVRQTSDSRRSTLLTTVGVDGRSRMMLAVGRRPSPVDHTQRPALRIQRDRRLQGVMRCRSSEPASAEIRLKRSNGSDLL